jgi:hypothetical protein
MTPIKGYLPGGYSARFRDLVDRSPGLWWNLHRIIEVSNLWSMWDQLDREIDR